MSTNTFTTIVLEKRQLNDQHVQLTLAKPEGFAYQSGQYILFSVPNPEHPEDVEDRGFSLASSPEDDHLVVLIKPTPHGRTGYWLNNLKEGISLVRFRGPFGDFVSKHRDDTHLVFVATGTGIAPLRSHIRSTIASHRGPIRLLWGLRSEEDIVWKDEFDAFAKEYPHFVYHITLSDPSADWQGHRGHVQHVLDAVINDVSDIHIYTCGHRDMVHDVSSQCFTRYGIPRECIFTEGY